MSEQDKSPGARPGVLALSIKEKAALYAAYMPQLKGGGLFIPTNRPFQIGEEVYMLISLLNEPERIPVAGRVAWITPAGAQGGRVQGIGVKFNEDESGARARNKIEALLGGMLKSGNPTHTL